MAIEILEVVPRWCRGLAKVQFLDPLLARRHDLAFEALIAHHGLIVVTVSRGVMR
jgi:hypothetical protein